MNISSADGDDLKSQMVKLLDRSAPVITLDEVRQRADAVHIDDKSSGTRLTNRRSRSTADPLRSRRQKTGVIYAFVICICLLVGVLIFTGTHKASPSATAGPASTPTTENIQGASGNPYPSDGCDAGDPVALVLPLGAIPGMENEVGAPSAIGGGSLDLHGGGPSSAAVIEEHWKRIGVPTSELDAQGPYEVAHPHSVVTYDEAITGFTDPSAESAYYDESFSEGESAPGQNQTVIVNGQSLLMDRSVQQNISSLPRPNVMVITNLPGTDVGARIGITVKFGNTIVGIGFFGGTDLTWPDVVSYAKRALGLDTSHCKNGQILPNT